MKFREANKVDRKCGGSPSNAFKLCPLQNRRAPTSPISRGVPGFRALMRLSFKQWAHAALFMAA
jgi:hypothetical protein